MKDHIKTCAVIVCVVALLCFVFLKPESSTKPKHSEDYMEGHSDGYAEGYSDGLKHAPEMMEKELLDEMRSLEQYLRAEYGMDSEDAFKILANYADGEPIDRDDLTDAMWAAWEYYREVEKITLVSSIDLD